MSEVLLGARFAVAGGRDGWTRTLFTAVGVGVGVALLLLAASVPGALQSREQRGQARAGFHAGDVLPAGPGTVLIASVVTTFRDQEVYGNLVRAEGPDAPVPPGLVALPRAGEAVVSPALRDLLDSPEGPLFAPRLGGARVTGVIGDEGLLGPGELAFYLGSDTLGSGRAVRLDRFGEPQPAHEPFGPMLTLLIVIIFVVLLLPITVFIGAAVRFGGERRDRRLAALRLIGADRRMTRRIATGETAVAALLGLAAGGLLFLAGRALVPLVTLWDISLYAGDVRPWPPLVVAIALAVPALAVVVNLAALRGVAVEPLGVTRRGVPPRRRIWWRLLLPATGLALLAPMAGGGGVAAAPAEYQAAAGTVLVLVGAVALLPWLIDLLVRRLGAGPVGWQLAVRRLQLDSATSARLVGGIAVAVAGTIGLQMLFAAVENRSRTAGDDVTRAQAIVRTFGRTDLPESLARLRGTPGVAGAVGTYEIAAALPRGGPDRLQLLVGDCAELAAFADLGRCADGDTFLVRSAESGSVTASQLRPGGRVALGDDGRPWTVPTGARRVPARAQGPVAPRDAILATPGALDPGTLPERETATFVRFVPGDPDALERVRSTVLAADPLAQVAALTPVRESNRFASIRRGLYLGIVVTLLLIASSMLVGVLEQLRERRRLLAMLVALGTPRRSLGLSVLWQTVLPVLVGLVLAVGFGLGLGVVLLRIAVVRVTISWAAVGWSAGLGAAAVLLTTALSLPALWRLTRPDGLRTE
ncbi:FtsX-like permease family protein [Sphaerisporangium melleum]|uniref:FtsX-like permease family protein n=1 Tax=Sphaerisporangium melleum TaxID=321316 RepID=UPI00194E9FE4|nr:FtsX-like permease family protein [Sphaerisporangium melleum]